MGRKEWAGAISRYRGCVMVGVWLGLSVAAGGLASVGPPVCHDWQNLARNRGGSGPGQSNPPNRAQKSLARARMREAGNALFKTIISSYLSFLH